MMRGRFLCAGISCIAAAAVAAAAGGPPQSLNEIRSSFTPLDAPIRMDYQLGYRFLNVELSRLGTIRLTTTRGVWRHRVTGENLPAVFVDVTVDSVDRNPKREKNRAWIHDEMVGVMTLPDLHALLFSKQTDEWLDPVFGRHTSMKSFSVYDTQSGRMEYDHRRLDGGELVKTNLTDPEALLELSRQVRPVMNYLIGQYRGAPCSDAPEQDRISVNLDGQVTTLRLATHPERSPACLDRRRIGALCVETVPEGKSRAKARDFLAWAVSFDDLALLLEDESLKAASRQAMVECMTPVVVDYELAIGRIRASLVSVGINGVPPAPDAEADPGQRPRNVQ